MNNPTLFWIATVYLLLALVFGYFPWFQPEEFLSFYKRKHAKTRAHGLLLPNSVIRRVLERMPRLELWSARIISLLAIVMSLVGVLAGWFFP